MIDNCALCGSAATISRLDGDDDYAVCVISCSGCLEDVADALNTHSMVCVGWDEDYFCGYELAINNALARIFHEG